MAFKALLQSRRVVPVLESQSGAIAAVDEATVRLQDDATVRLRDGGRDDGAVVAGVIVDGRRKTQWRGRGTVWIKWVNGVRLSSSKPQMSAAAGEI